MNSNIEPRYAPLGGFALSNGFNVSNGMLACLAACADFLVVCGSGVGVYLLYPGWDEAHFPMYLSATGIYALLVVLMFSLAEMYNLDAIFDTFHTRKQLPKIVLVCTAALLVLLAAAFAMKISSAFSRNWAFSWLLVSIFGIYLNRMLARLLLLHWSQDGRLTRNIAIVGAGEQGKLLFEFLKKQQYPWLRVIGVFDDRHERVAESIQDCHLSGDIDTLLDMARKERIDDILVALPWGAEDRILAILDKLQVLPANVRLSSDRVGFKFPFHGYSYYNGVPALNVYDKPLSGGDYLLKSIEDKVLGTIILALIFPILIVIAILIKLDSPGPVLFRQKRYGFNNQLIEVWKFRSMRVDMQDDHAAQLTTKDDPRVTRLGRILRKTSLDELPQFFNVLTGEMSIVGPRPHATQAKAAGRLYENVVHQYAARHKVKPGITGWAQVNGWRGDTDTEEKILKRVEYDIDYINHWSLGQDLKIILKTVSVVFGDQNAY